MAIQQDRHSSLSAVLRSNRQPPARKYAADKEPFQGRRFLKSPDETDEGAQSWPLPDRHVILQAFREALAILGYQKVYHMSYVFEQKPSDSKFWLRAFDFKYRGQGQPFTRADWDTVLGDSDAVSDFPCAAFSEELIAAYPEAKVVITVRDSPQVWYESVLKTVWHVHMLSPFAPHKLLGQPCLERSLPPLFQMGKRMFGDVFDRDLPRTGTDVYERHIERVRALVPRNNLLIFNVKDGWEPLCAFLGVPVPETPIKEGRIAAFPKVNEGQAVVAKVLRKQAALRQDARRVGLVVLVLVVAVSYACKLLLSRYWIR